MRRTPGSLVKRCWPLALLLAACNHAGPGPAAASPHASNQPSACDAPPGLSLETSDRLPATEPSFGTRVLAVELTGAEALPRALVRTEIETRPGQALDEARVAADVRRLLALEALADVRVETESKAEGVSVRYVLVPRRVIGSVGHRGLRSLPAGRWLPLVQGEIYDPARVTRAARGLARELRDSGYLDATVEPRARLAAAAKVDVCLSVQPGQRFTVDRVDFPGAHAVAEEALRELIHAEGGEANVRGAPYREDLLERDLLWISARYYDEGFVQVKVGPPRLERDSARGRLRVLIPVDEGPRFVFGKLRFRGSKAKNQRELRALLGLEEGKTFDHGKVLAGIQRVEQHYGTHVSVTPESAIDSERHRVDLTLVLEAAP